MPSAQNAGPARYTGHFYSEYRMLIVHKLNVVTQIGAEQLLGPEVRITRSPIRGAIVWC